MGKSIFIDIKENELETYVFDVKHGEYEIKDSRKYPLHDGYDFSLDGLAGDVENAYMSLPLSSLNFRMVELSFSDKEKIREVLPFELDGIILGGSDKVVFDDIIVGKSGDKYQILAVYVEKTLLNKIIGKLKSYSIDPEFITSIELKEMLNDFSLPKLLTPRELEEKERAGLAVEEIKTPTINLRRDEFSFTRDIEKTKKSLKVTAVLVILFALVLSADLLLKIVSTKQEISYLKNDMRKIYQGIFPGEKNIQNELYQLKSHMKELKNKEQFLIGISPLNLLLQLSQIEKQGIVFNEISEQSGNLTLKGEAPSLGDIQQLKNKLELFFNEVNISDSKASVQGNMLFTIIAKEKSV